MLGGHLIKSWSSTQPVIALSSGEAELYALVKGASQATGLMSMLFDYGLELGAKVCIDSSAALGIAHRVGLGKTRHIDVQYLWIQEKVSNKELSVTKVRTEDNPADILTKYLKSETLLKHTEALGGRLETRRADGALRIAAVGRSDRWLEDDDWTRVHTKPRLCLFTPMKVAGGPKGSNEVGRSRTTHGEYADGEKFIIEDDWISVDNPHRKLKGWWTGYTVFRL